MKYTLLFLVLVFCFIDLRSQEGTVSLSGGYVLTDLRKVRENAFGFRINGTYEFIPDGSKWSIPACYLFTANSEILIFIGSITAIAVKKILRQYSVSKENHPKYSILKQGRFTIEAFRIDRTGNHLEFN